MQVFCDLIRLAFRVDQYTLLFVLLVAAGLLAE
jgi:hypothetical protein